MSARHAMTNVARAALLMFCASVATDGRAARTVSCHTTQTKAHARQQLPQKPSSPPQKKKMRRANDCTPSAPRAESSAARRGAGSFLYYTTCASTLPRITYIQAHATSGVSWPLEVHIRQICASADPSNSSHQSALARALAARWPSPLIARVRPVRRMATPICAGQRVGVSLGAVRAKRQSADQPHRDGDGRPDGGGELRPVHRLTACMSGPQSQA